MKSEDIFSLERSITRYIHGLNLFNNVNVCCYDDGYSEFVCTIYLFTKPKLIGDKYAIRFHFLNPSDVTAEKIDLALKSHPVLKQALVEKELDDILSEEDK